MEQWADATGLMMFVFSALGLAVTLGRSEGNWQHPAAVTAIIILMAIFTQVF